MSNLGEKMDQSEKTEQVRVYDPNTQEGRDCLVTNIVQGADGFLYGRVGDRTVYCDVRGWTF